MIKDTKIFEEYRKQTGYQIPKVRSLSKATKVLGFADYISTVEGLSEKEEKEYSRILEEITAIDKDSKYDLYICAAIYAVVFIFMYFNYGNDNSIGWVLWVSLMCCLGLVVPIALVWSFLSGIFRNIAKSGIRGIEIYPKLIDKVILKKRASLQFWNNLDGIQFENEVARIYELLGYSVTKTKASGDKGIDLDMRKDGKRVIVQCKAHQKTIGTPVVRDMIGTLAHSRADKGIIVSISGFSQQTDEFIAGRPIELVALSDLLRLEAALGSRRMS